MVCLSKAPFLRSDCNVQSSIWPILLGQYTGQGKGTRMLGTQFGDYSYTDGFAEVANADIGKFANIAAFLRI